MSYESADGKVFIPIKVTSWVIGYMSWVNSQGAWWEVFSLRIYQPLLFLFGGQFDNYVTHSETLAWLRIFAIFASSRLGKYEGIAILNYSQTLHN